MDIGTECVYTDRAYYCTAAKITFHPKYYTPIYNNNLSLDDIIMNTIEYNLDQCV